MSLDTAATEISNPASTESTGVASPTVNSSPGGGSTASVDGQGTQADDQTVVAPVFTPNFKFKANNKEHEFDTHFQQMVKDADSEKKIRELHEKAYGLDGMKPKFQKLEEDYRAMEGKYQPLSKSLETLSAHLNMGDFDTFFGKVGVPEQAVFQWVLNKLRAADLPQEQRQYQEEAMDAKRRTYELEQQNQELMQGAQTAEVRERGQQLESALARPDVQQTAQAFDQRQGAPGSFRDFVINQATAMFYRTGSDITAEQAVAEAVRLLGGTGQAGQPGTVASQGAQAQTGTQDFRATQGSVVMPPPVIPNVSGRNTSPTRKTVRSIDDLKKLASSY